MNDFAEDLKAGLGPLKGKKRYLMISLSIALAAIWAFLPFWMQFASAFLFGMTLAILFLAVAAPLYKNQLLHNPNDPDQTKMLVEVQPGRHTIIIQGGRPRYIIEGGKLIRKKVADNEGKEQYSEYIIENQPEEDESWFAPWFWWQKYMYWATGYHAYLPFFTKPYTYVLPRYELEVDKGTGDKLYKPREDRSNHVRVETAVWYFEYTGVDIQKVPFLIRGSVQFRIVPGLELKALFGVDSWNVLLDQALSSTIRNYLRAEMTLDDVLGRTPENIWDDATKPKIDLDEIGKGIRKALVDKYKIKVQGHAEENDMKLIDLGINIQRVDIVDFVDELPKEERARFFAAVIGREEGRAIHLRGQGTAKAEAELLNAHKDGGEVSETIIKHRAIVDAAKGSDILGALAAGFARKQIGDK